VEIQQPIHGQEADAVERMREMFAHQPEPLRTTGTDDTAVENSESARSARRSVQDTKPCVSGATGCDNDAFKPHQRKHPSLYVLRTWARKCKPVRLTAKVAEEGLELVVVFRGKMGEISEKASTY